MQRKFETLRFGVNYTPTRNWWYCWNDFDAGAIARDLDAIADLHADHIRIMLLWPFFQPNPAAVSTAHLDRLDRLMELAAERKLDVCATMLTGWLSGWAFRPPYDERDAFYASTKIREAVEIYFRACAGRLNQHSHFLGFDLGNEINCCWKAATPDEGDAWMDWLLSLCDEISPGRVHVNGVDHQPWFSRNTFSPRALARRPALATIHSWIGFTGALDRGRALERPCTHLAPAMAALVRAYAGGPDKPVWLQEFGASNEWMEEAEIVPFLEKAAEAAIRGGICWLTWWSSHDVDRRFRFDSLEYDLGLITVGQDIKPAGLAFRRLARAWAGKPVFQSPAPAEAPKILEPATTWTWLLETQRQLDALESRL